MRGISGLLLLLTALTVATVAWAQPERPVYVVEPGDTLYGLAIAHGTSVAELRRLNALQGDLLRVGAELVLPGSALGQPGYRPYLGGEGETWETVSAATGRGIGTLTSANPDVPADGDVDGRLLLIPPGEGVTYRARLGDSVAALAATIGVDEAEVASINGVTPGEALIAGQPVLLPVDASEAAELLRARTTASGAVGAAPRVDPRSMHHDAQALLLVRAPMLLVGFAWPDIGFEMPVAGTLSSTFGWRNISVGGNRFHGGIDIAAPPGTLVAVARSGIVTRTGWIGAYGNAVYVDHGDGSQTRYAHMLTIYVRPGEALVRGDLVGEVGSTGASTGPHLHFEVRIDGRAVDPLGYVELR